MTKALYVTDTRNPFVVAVIDLHGHTTVTQDIHAVINELAEHDADLPIKRVIYRDTNGRWDGVRIINGQVTGYIPLGFVTTEEAIELANDRQDW